MRTNPSPLLSPAAAAAYAAAAAAAAAAADARDSDHIQPASSLPPVDDVTPLPRVSAGRIRPSSPTRLSPLPPVRHTTPPASPLPASPPPASPAGA